MTLHVDHGVRDIAAHCGADSLAGFSGARGEDDVAYLERLSGATVTGKAQLRTAILAETYTIPLLDERHNCAAARAHDRPNSCCA